MGAPSEPRTSGLERPQTPHRLSWLADNQISVNDALGILGELADIRFPLLEDKQSPAKKNKSPTHEIKRLFSQLFFTNRDALCRRIETFVDYLDARIWNGEDDAKVVFLQSTLSAENESNVQLIRSARTNRIISLVPETEASASLTQSPTMLAKHLPHSTTEDMEEITLPAKIISNTTSANTSFWSEAQQGSQDPLTPATPIDESFTQDYGSSWNESDMSTFQGKLAAAGISTGALEHNGTGLDGAHDVWTTQETYYGSSPRSSQVPQQHETTLNRSSGEVAENLSATTGTTSSEIAANTSSGAAAVIASDTTLKTSPHPAAVNKSSRSMLGNLSKPKAVQSPKVVANQPSKDVADKPSKFVPEHVRVRKIESDGLTDLQLPASILELDLDRRSAFYLVAQSCNVDPQDLAQQWTKPRTLSSLHTIASKLIPGFRPFGNNSYAECSLRAKMRISDCSGGRLMIMEHIRPQKQLFTQLEKEFGSHRFLTIDVEPFKPPQCLGMSDQTEYIKRRFQNMIAQPQEFLGCEWRQFYAQERTKRKIGEEAVKSCSMQFVFFAVTGRDLEPISLYTVLDAALQFSDPENENKSLCKLYARLDLAMSRTYFIDMGPDEIEFIDDIHAKDNELEDTRFDDPELPFSFEFKEKTVMNDGCCQARLPLFQRIRDTLGHEHLVTGVQFRSAGAKGVAHLMSPDSDTSSDPGCEHAHQTEESLPVKPLLSITESMRKVKIPDEILKDPVRGKIHRDLRIVNFVHSLKPSYLYSDFLTILKDRHVPTKAIEDLVGSQAEKDVQDFQEALASGDLLRCWLHNQYAAREDQQRNSEIETIANFPTTASEKVIQMLDAGFEPTKCQALADLIQNIANAFFDQRRKAYKIPLAKSTMAIAIADPDGHLQPGEAQLNPSLGFVDPSTGLPMRRFEGRALVGRSPSNRPSDIQVVMLVNRPECSHIVDQIIFPSTGPRPLAGKCSGGDYDGDKFWICWEPTIVEHFRNAPAPWSLPDPESMGIRVDRTITREVVSQPGSEEQARAFIRRGTAHRMKGTLLGVLTKNLERQTHADNSMSTEKARAQADLKDTIIDSDKNGYDFDRNDLAKFNEAHGIKPLPYPAYTRFTGKNKDPSREYAPVNEDNILDKVHCVILPAILEKGLQTMKEKLAEAVDEDEMLSKEYEERLADAQGDPVIYAEFVRLENELVRVKAEWGRQMGLWKAAEPLRKSAAWESAVLRCRGMLDAIEPQNQTHALLKEWCRRSGSSQTTWELIKASAIAKFHPKGKMMFNIVGWELCELKSRETGPTRRVLTKKYLDYKPKKRKRVVEEVVDEGPADEIDEDDVDMED